MKDKNIIDTIRGKLIVSCQALETEPLYSPYIMSRMAYAAMLGGASGIRANTVEDIIEIKKLVDLPIIGIIKKQYSDSEVYISPTIKEIDLLVDCGAQIVATDATCRLRPNGQTLDEFFAEVRKKYPDQLFMADCSNVEEGLHAANIGFDIIGTTMSGYTAYTEGVSLPNYPMMKALVEQSGCDVIAEGGIWTPEQLKKALECGVTAAVVGTAITRPMEITERFAKAISMF